MATLPLDLDDLIGELGGPQDMTARMPAGTTIGHVHLQVAELSEIEAFYGGILGLDVTVRLYQQALFMSAGGYHHHLGLNTWQSHGGSRPVPGAVGLRDYELKLGDGDDLGRILSRAAAAGYPVEDGGDASAPQLRDPSGNAVRLVLPDA
jgi:catechol 2,3-dioxygenase